MIDRHTIVVVLLASVAWGSLSSPARADDSSAIAQLPPIEYVYEGTTVRGNDHTRARFFTDILDLEPGESISVAQLDELRQRLLATGYFEDVQMRLLPGGAPHSVVIEIRVQEQNTVRIRDVFFGVSADTPIWGGLEVAETNLFGTGLVLSGGFVVSPDQGALTTFLADPHGSVILPIPSRVEAYFTDALGEGPVLRSGISFQAAFDYRRLGGRMGVSIDPWPWLSLRPSVRIEALFSEGTEPDGLHPRTGFVTGSSLLDTLSLQLEVKLPRRQEGFLESFRATLWAEGSARELGSDYRFLRLTSRVGLGHRIAGAHILRYDLSGGFLFSPESAPFSEGFYVGNLTPLVPSLNLGLQFTDRRSLDLLGNGADLVTHSDRFVRFLVEWAVPINRSYGTSRRVEIFLTAGVFTLRRGPWEIGRPDERVDASPTGNAEGDHVDLTFDLGVRGDTPIGFFSFSISNVLALAPLN